MWFPLIGFLLGAIYSLFALLLRGHLPSLVLAVLLVLLDAMATGALHFDALADTADGFGGGRERDDVLRIMRDHAIGSYGGSALALVVVLKVTVYAALLERTNWITALILAPGLARWSILLLTAALPYARPGASVIGSMRKSSLIWGTGTVLLATAAVRSARSWVALTTVVFTSVLFGLYCRRRIGGVTGDMLGANVELCESAALISFLWIR